MSVREPDWDTVAEQEIESRRDHFSGLREIGRVSDIYTASLTVAAHHGCVGIGSYWLTLDQAEQLAQLFIRACWEAARQDGAP
jgi:hypothetical protein